MNRTGLQVVLVHLAKLLPTYALQDALTTKEGVTAIHVLPYGKFDEVVEGPCIVTINID